VVAVTGRGELSAVPTLVAVGRTRPQAVTGWAGPWPCDEHWWDPGRRRRRARLQVVLADGTAHVLTLEDGRWAVEATYD
jgi:protein ImuB